MPATCPYPKPARSSPCPHISLPKIPFYSINPSTPESPKWSLSLRLPHQNHLKTSALPILATTRQYPSSGFHHPKKLGEYYRSLSSSLSSFLQFHLNSSLTAPNVLLETLLSKSLTLSFSQVSNPYKTTGKVLVLCILMSKLLDSELEDKIFSTER